MLIKYLPTPSQRYPGRIPKRFGAELEPVYIFLLDCCRAFNKVNLLHGRCHKVPSLSSFCFYSSHNQTLDRLDAFLLFACWKICKNQSNVDLRVLLVEVLVIFVTRKRLFDFFEITLDLCKTVNDYWELLSLTFSSFCSSCFFPLFQTL